MTKETCWTSIPLAQTSVEIKTRDFPERKSVITVSLSSCFMSPCIETTVKFEDLIFSVSQSTFFLVLQKITACVIVSESYKSHNVSNFHSSFSTEMKYCLIPSKVNSSLLTKILTGSVVNFPVTSNTSLGKVALTTTAWHPFGNSLLRLLIISRTLPGVPLTTWTPLANVLTSLLTLVPPIQACD
ncbi:hypothetical protein WICPIJ_009269 [Wickerhamomyces pijperi]|uniref:Uncharacterized protein n=1 Tax=Wickerhamomyces pijperi TaxID=599730 RepID=A0A9P8TEV8_WICPI|nr:hypothetical protein WICPIJ_009269 [Wickerhamomyces pijperi]